MKKLKLNREELYIVAFALDDIVVGAYGNDRYQMSEVRLNDLSGFARDDFAKLRDELDILKKSADDDRLQYDFSTEELSLMLFALDQMLHGEYSYGDELRTVLGYEANEVESVVNKVKWSMRR